MKEIPEQLRAFVIEHFLFGRSDQRLSDDDSLIENGIIDSTGVLMLVSFLEQNLGVHVEDHEIVPENLDSINRLAAFAARKLGRNPSEAVVSAFASTSAANIAETFCSRNRT